jgi:hypothetical protein
MDRAPLTPYLAETVNRLGQIREQLKALTTEESALRDAILAVVETWPAEWFPVRVGAHQLKLSHRPGKLDREGAETTLARLRLSARVPREARVAHPERAREFPSLARGMNLPPDTTEALLAAYEEIIEWTPVISVELLEGWHDGGVLEDADYAACFRDGRPEILVLTVR